MRGIAESINHNVKKSLSSAQSDVSRTDATRTQVVPYVYKISHKLEKVAARYAVLSRFLPPISWPSYVVVPRVLIRKCAQTSTLSDLFAVLLGQ